MVRSVNWLGDAIMTLPALVRLREACPNARITMVTAERWKDLWTDHPAVDRVLAFASPATLWHVARLLHRQEFDTAVIFPNSPRSALEALLAGIPRRYGFATPWRRFLLTHPVTPPGASQTRRRSVAEIKRLLAREPAGGRTRPDRRAHHSHRYLSLVGALGANPMALAPALPVPAAALRAIDTRLGAWRDPQRGLIGMAPGAAFGPAKRWPAESFARTALEVHRRTGCQWLLVGSAAERDTAREIFERLCAAGVERAVCNLAGETSLGELSASLKLCRVVLSNDSGAMHLAAAVGSRVVALFGSTSAELTGPEPFAAPNRRHRVLDLDVPCAPCFRRECPIDFRCMRNLTVEQVSEAIIALIGKEVDGRR